MEWAALIIGIISAIVSAGVNIHTNKQNIAMQRETNDLNATLSREANAAQAMESQKAYDQSKAPNQVNLMRAAGMSKAGALSALSGGGVYTPAPVNTAQATSPVSNTDGLLGVLQSLSGDFSNAGQLRHQKDALKRQQEEFDANMKEQQRVNDASIAESEARAAATKYDTFVKVHSATATSWIAEAIDSLGEDVTSSKVMNYIKEHHGKEEAFVAMDNVSLNNFVSSELNERKTKVDTANAGVQGDILKFERDHQQKRFDAEMRAALDSHLISDLQYKQLTAEYDRFTDPQAVANWRKKLSNEELHLMIDETESFMKQHNLKVERSWQNKYSSYVDKYWTDWNAADLYSWVMDNISGMLDKVPLMGDFAKLLGKFLK